MKNKQPRTEFINCKVCGERFERNVSIKSLLQNRSSIRKKRSVTCNDKCSRMYRARIYYYDKVKNESKKK